MTPAQRASYFADFDIVSGLGGITVKVALVDS